MDLGLAQVFIKAFVLLGILRFAAKDEADLNFMKVALVVALIGLANIVMEGFAAPKIGYFVIVPEVALTLFLLMKMLWLSFKKAVVVLIPYMAFSVILAFGWALLISRVDSTVDAAGGTVVERDQHEGLQVLHDINAGTMRMAGATEEEIAAQDAAFKESMEPEKTGKKPGLADFVSRFLKKDDDPPPEPEEAVEPPAEPSPPVWTGPYAPPDDPEWDRAWRTIKINSRAYGRGGLQMAIIGGETVVTGEIFPITYRDRIYQYRLKQLTRLDAEWEPVYEPPDTPPAKDQPNGLDAEEEW